MVMSHQHNINAQFRKHWRKLCSPLYDVTVRIMICHTVCRVVECYHSPQRILIFLQCIFKKCLVLGCICIVRVNRHKEHAIVNKPVIAASIARVVAHAVG